MMEQGIPAIGYLAGSALGVGGAKLYSKVTGKPAGVPASVAHVLTNDKLDKQGKKEVLIEQTKESLKDTAKLTGLAAAAAGATAIATGCSNKVAGIAKNAMSKAGSLLSTVAVKGKDLKSIIKDTKVFQKFNSLPTPAKAAIAVAGAVIALAAPIVNLVSAQKAGYIEGKHEAK